MPIMMEPPTGPEDLQFYSSGAMNAGINVNAADITIGPDAINSLPLTKNTYNFSAGRQAGWTTRYGIFPVPGHNSYANGDLITAGFMTGYTMRNVVSAEQSQTAISPTYYDVYDRRTFLMGAVTVALPIGQTIAGSTVPLLYWISFRKDKSDLVRLDLMPSTEVIATGHQMGIRSHFEAGIGSGTAVLSVGATNQTSDATVDPQESRTMQAIDRLGCANEQALRYVPTSYDKKYIHFTQVQSTISTNINEAICFNNDTDNDPGAKPGIGYFDSAGAPFWVTDKPQKKQITFDVAVSAGLNPKKWSNKWFMSTTAGDLVPAPMVSRSSVFGGLASAVTTAGGSLDFHNVSTAYKLYGAYAHTASGGASDHFRNKVYFCRFNDQPMTVPITVLGMVMDKPLIALWNPFIKDSTEQTADLSAVVTMGNDFVQWIDPTDNIFKAQTYQTTNGDGTGTASYKETWASGGVAIAKQTCWANAPAFVFGTNTANVIPDVGGLLMSNKTYEYAYSIYNVLNGKESNVGVPASAFIGTDSSAIQVYQSVSGAGLTLFTLENLFPIVSCDNYEGATGTTLAGSMFGQFIGGMVNKTINWVNLMTPINYLYYRLYYREKGSFEWLFAGQHSFAKIAYDRYTEAIYIGKTDAIGPTGGQPGAFNDYSDLPTDNYIDVTNFRGRLFWLSRGQVVWSRSDDLLSYPARCSAPAPAGEFRGMIPHFFYGQAAQAGRLVFFASDGNYEGRFTGEFIQDQVRVSATAQPIAVDVDGTDFKIYPRSTDTAFSGRSAVVAEGILYFMGPTGIWRDNGVDPAKRITPAIEPDYFDCFDPSKTDEFFAYYNKKSREVLFFYRPNPNRTDLNPNSFLTKAWVYSLRTENMPQGYVDGILGAWTQYGYNSLIDWAQDLDLTRFETPVRGGGTRTLIGARADASGTVSRPYFHDDDCDGGDYEPGTEMMVKAIQTPDSTTVRLVLATGFSSTILTALVDGTTQIAVKLSSTYGEMVSTANIDGIYTVKAHNVGAGTIDIDNTGLETVIAQTFTLAQYFPIFVAGYHDVACTFQTNYLSPKGIYRYMLTRYLHMLIKPIKQLLGSGIPTGTAQWEPNHQQSANTSTKIFSVYPLNSRETTTQVMLDVPSSDMQAEAQAVRTTLTYNQIAGRWTLFAATHYYEDRGADETKYYQQ